MTSMLIFLFVVGLVVFGPKKTIGMAQACGQSLGQLKKTAGRALIAPDAEGTGVIDTEMSKGPTE